MLFHSCVTPQKTVPSKNWCPNHVTTALKRNQHLVIGMVVILILMFGDLLISEPWHTSDTTVSSPSSLADVLNRSLWPFTCCNNFSTNNLLWRGSAHMGPATYKMEKKKKRHKGKWGISKTVHMYCVKQTWVVGSRVFLPLIWQFRFNITHWVTSCKSTNPETCNSFRTILWS